MPFGQHQDTELWKLWNNQFPETKILGLPVSRRMRGLVYMASTSRNKVNVDTLHKGIQYALEKLGKSKFGFESITYACPYGFESITVSNFKSKRHESSGNELVDYSRAPCLGADQAFPFVLQHCDCPSFSSDSVGDDGLWERDC